MAESTFTAIIDRFEGETAVLIVEENCMQVCVPADLLPASAGEGTMLRVKISIDAAGTEASRQRIRRIVRRLGHDE